MIVIGVTGTIGAGKGTVAEYLVQKGFHHFSVREYLAKILAERGQPTTFEYIRPLANELREKNGPGFLASELLREALETGTNSVIESIRTPGEVELLREQSPVFFLLAVDATSQRRYERVVKRASDTDHVTYEQFMAEEALQNENGEPWKQNIAMCIKMADAVIHNDGTLEELHAQVDAALEKFSMLTK